MIATASLSLPYDDPPTLVLDTTAPYQKASAASREARDHKLPSVSKDKRAILRYLLRVGQASNREIERDTGLKYATVCARRNDLVFKDALVEEVWEDGKPVKEYVCGPTGAVQVRIIPWRVAEVRALLKEAA